jgi:hypothetical protein
LPRLDIGSLPTVSTRQRRSNIAAMP